MPDKVPQSEPSGSLLIDLAILEGNTHIDTAHQEWEDGFLAEERAAAMVVMEMAGHNVPQGNE